ncbi:hypothetical protein D3C76_1149910 [compost metagenome]
MVGEGGVVGVVALIDQPGFVVGPPGTSVKGIDMAEQAAFGIALEAVGGLVRMDNQYQLAGFVLVLGYLTGGVDQFDQLTHSVVLPLCGLARAIGIADQLPVAVVRQFLLTTVGVGDGDGQVVAVVGVEGFILQRILGFDDVAALVVVVFPQPTFGIAGLEALAQIIVRMVDGCAIGACML